MASIFCRICFRSHSGAHLRVSKQSPGTFEVIIILLALQYSGASMVAEEVEGQMTAELMLTVIVPESISMLLPF